MGARNSLNKGEDLSLSQTCFYTSQAQASDISAVSVKSTLAAFSLTFGLATPAFAAPANPTSAFEAGFRVTRALSHKIGTDFTRHPLARRNAIQSKYQAATLRHSASAAGW
jgi:hypothetical protein